MHDAPLSSFFHSPNSVMVSNKQVLFTKIPTTFPVAGEHMQVKESQFDLDAPLAENEYVIKNLALSVDPYMRGRMRDASIKSYAPAFPLNKPMTGNTMSVVVKSNNPSVKEGDLVYGLTGAGVFEEYTKVTGPLLNYYKVRNDPKSTGLPITNYLGVLGMPGMTAYVG